MTGLKYSLLQTTFVNRADPSFSHIEVGSHRPIFGEHGVDQLVAPLALDELVAAKVRLLAHSNALEQMSRPYIPRVESSRDSLRSVEGDRDIHSDPGRFSRQTLPPCFRQEDVTDVTGAIRLADQPDTDLSDETALVLHRQIRPTTLLRQPPPETFGQVPTYIISYEHLVIQIAHDLWVAEETPVGFEVGRTKITHEKAGAVNRESERIFHLRNGTTSELALGRKPESASEMLLANGYPAQYIGAKSTYHQEVQPMSDVVHVSDPLGHEGPPLERRPIQIVPLRGLPVAGVAMVIVVVAIATNNKWALMFCHVVGGGLWTAIDLFVGLIVGPILGRLSIPARAEFSARFMPKMLIIMPTVVTMTLAAGFQMARKVGNLSTANPNHAWLIVSFCVVGVMAVIALGVLEPANVAVLFEMNKPVPNGARIQRLMNRFIYTAGITGIMQIATLVIMTRVASR